MFVFAMIIYMNVYAISDPHLSTVVNKPMTIFGEHWNNYWEIITEDWKSKVKDDDVVIVSGDISWGLNLDEAKDLLARAGYALSPANKTDIIFSYFLERGIYDMMELDIQLEEHGEKYLIG